MMFLFESIIEVLLNPLANWDKLKVKYKIIFSVIFIISIIGIVILINGN